MKKLIALLMMVCLAVMPFAAFAEAAPEGAVVIHWEDVSAMTEGVEGDFWYNEDLGLKFWLPTGFQEIEFTQEQADQGIVNLYATSDNDAAIAVSYVDIGGDFDAFLSQMAENGASDFEEDVINGLYGVSFTMKDTDTAVVAFPTEAGAVLTYTIAPVSNEVIATALAIILASIQPAE